MGCGRGQAYGDETEDGEVRGGGSAVCGYISRVSGAPFAVHRQPLTDLSRWSDGLGNLEKNALPRCQLDRIQSLAHALLSSKTLQAASPKHFWIDNFGVPVGPERREIRREAIAMMANIYKAASAVLVSLRHLVTSPPPTQRPKSG